MSASSATPTKTPEFPAFEETPLLRRLLRHRTWRRLLPALGLRYIRARMGPVRLTLDIADRSGVSKYILRYGDYAPTVTRIMREAITAHGAVLDVGANIGYHALLAASLTAGPVYAFEPEPENLRLLRHNIAGSAAAVTVVPRACGAAPGTARLYRNPANAGDHRLYASDEARDAVEVPVVRIDDEIRGLTGIDFIKIDVQGYEQPVVQGMEGTLAANPGAVVVTEFWPGGIRRAGGDPRQLLELLGRGGRARRVVHDRRGRLSNPDAAGIFDLCRPDAFVDLLFAPPQTLARLERSLTLPTD